MNIAFRTDVSAQIGTGHFMRCLTLANKLKKHGAEVVFISRNLPEHFSELLLNSGMEYRPFTGELIHEETDELFHSKWLGTSQIQDVRLTIQALRNEIFDWIVVDHYALDKRWESAVRTYCKSLMVIDDLADRQHDCDVLLDQNYYSDFEVRYKDKVSENCLKLLGPKFALLREEFTLARQRVGAHSGDVKKILVFFSGVDEKDFTSLAIKALAELNRFKHVDVVIGASHPKFEKIKKICKEYGYICHVQTNRIAELMAQADLAIGAGGTATWERCCLGLPNITLCLAENQRKQIFDAAEIGLLYAPTKNDSSLIDLIRLHIIALAENPSLIRLISKSGMEMVSGNGCDLVVDIMGFNPIKIRSVVKSDLRKLYEWRNHPKIRNVSKNSRLIEWKEHEEWFDLALADKNRELVVGTLGGITVGVVRFDIEGIIAEISIYLDPSGSFSGYGQKLLLSAESWLRKKRADIKIIKADVLKDNESSRNLFFRSGYRLTCTSYEKNI